jgi:hypothetical protein
LIQPLLEQFDSLISVDILDCFLFDLGENGGRQAAEEPVFKLSNHLTPIIIFLLSASCHD